MKIKVCGMKYKDNINEVAALRPDFMGFIFYKSSLRYVGDDWNVEWLNVIPSTTKRVGVFVNEDLDAIKKKVEQFHLDYVQLHGSESSEVCLEMREKTGVIKAFGVDELFDLSILNGYKNCCDMFLFDTKTSSHGGSGRTFPWRLLDQYNLDVPFLLSGGIGPERTKEILISRHPKMFGLDLNHGLRLHLGSKTQTH